MELKKALAVCLIAFFSATLVVLIARMLDSQAAARLEPQLIRIADELRALRKSGQLAKSASPSASTDSAATEAGSVAAQEAPDDCLMVYYFHGAARCPTCRAIELQGKELVEREFGKDLDAEKIMWRVLNYDEPAGKPLAKIFKAQDPVIVLARMNDGVPVEPWKRLDRVFVLVNDKKAFDDYLRKEIRDVLDTLPPAAAEKTPETTPPTSTIPVPE